ncbi:GHKL domain-containing protein [Nocardia cyriacigeorgica]|uniref:histidine kinase n=1 Tax=Nocardia cyriacigeorgica TaxID=135487 RepID=A0ABX0CIJ3_9NOCA|nr:ATP-binding protein [Nocardia cyriacigeorgica]NEW55072.1 GHKL domain-containing protein [Nocardia cyriacigeorgica]
MTARRKRASLARQLLVLQLLIIVSVLTGVVAVSLAQSAQAFQRNESRRVLAAAETLAANPTVRELIPAAQPRLRSALPVVAESVRSVSGASSVTLADADGTVLVATDPDLVGHPMPLGDSTVTTGRAWTGLVDTQQGPMVEAHVPVIGAEGAMVGVAVVGQAYPSRWQRLQQAVPNLLIYLGVASLVGAVGSLLLSSRIKRQTLGMEPREIVELAEHRDAMLHGLKEGVLALDLDNRVTVVSDSAWRLLDLPADSVGRHLDDLPIEPRLRTMLGEAHTRADQLVLVGDRILALNRMPILARGRPIGSVTTLRDRTELSSLEEELNASKTSSDALRLHIHEFNNQLHTISGLIQLGEYDEVVRFVEGLTAAQSRRESETIEHIADPGVAALLIAKTAVAEQLAVSIRVDPDSALGRIDEDLSRDVVTVVGNLVDNAVDAVSGEHDPQHRVVTVLIEESDEDILVRVSDRGPGVAATDVERVFEQGWSSKTTDGGSERGFGLALVRWTCRRHGGDAAARAGRDGAVFTARMRKDGNRR